MLNFFKESDSLRYCSILESTPIIDNDYWHSVIIFLLKSLNVEQSIS